MDKRINNITKETITIGRFPSSKKIYLKGKIFSDIRVPMRQIKLSKEAKPNTVHLYDTSGVYSEFKNNDDFNINLGLIKNRDIWIKQNKSIIKYIGRKVTYKDNGFTKKSGKILHILKKKKMFIRQKKVALLLSYIMPKKEL